MKIHNLIKILKILKASLIIIEISKLSFRAILEINNLFLVNLIINDHLKNL